MSDEQQKVEGQIKAYREKHGAATLKAYVGRGTRWMCKHHDGQRALLLKLGSYDELIVSADEFKAEFRWYLHDEAVFFFGSKEQQSILSNDIREQEAAIQRCIGASSVPALILTL